jgi:hypothetical protein
MHKQQKCSKSRSVSNDSNLEENNVSPQAGLKLVLKRQSGDSYEVKTTTNQQMSVSLNESMFKQSNSTTSSSASTRPKREASRKVKFKFNDYETDFGSIEPTKKRAKLSDSLFLNNSLSATSTSYTSFIQQNAKTQLKTLLLKPEIVKVNLNGQQQQHQQRRDSLNEIEVEYVSKCSSKAEIQAIMKNPPTVRIIHSKPFPIALVEDKNNVVHTKACLFLHLFQTYLSQCIHCPWCKKLLNVSEFSKHLHMDQMDDDDDEDEDDDDGDERNIESDEIELETQEERQRHFQLRKREIKFAKLSKKSFKILPYCFNNNEELSEQDIRRWKIFGDKFAQFKQKHTKNLREQQLKETASKTLQLIENEKQNKTNSFNDWDHVDENTKVFTINTDRIASDTIVYLINNETSGRGKQSNDKSAVNTNSDDVFLSEDDEKEEKINLNNIKSKSTFSSYDSADVTPQSSSLNPKCFQYLKKPSLTECFFNLYDNLAKETLIYINKNPFTIVPNIFLDYCNKNRKLKLNNIKLAKTKSAKVLWLCLTLDLEC